MNLQKSLIEQLIREQANKALPSSHVINQSFMQELVRNLETGLSVLSNPDTERSPVVDPEREERDYKHAVLKATKTRGKHRLSLDRAYQKELKAMELLQADVSLYKRKLPQLKDSSIDIAAVCRSTSDFAHDLHVEVTKLQLLHKESKVLSLAMEIHAKLVEELEEADEAGAA